MIGVRVVGAEEVAHNIAKGSREAQGMAYRLVRRGSLMVRKELVERLSSRARTGGGFWGPGAVAGAYLGARRGQTRARLSPGGMVLRRGNQFSAAVGSPDRHVLLHEEGGTVTGNPFLRIPTAAAMTPAGVDRNVGRSVRGTPGMTVVRTRAGKLWLVQEEGGAASRRLTFMYLLKRSVHFRARHMFAEGTAKVRPQIEALGALEVQSVVRVANG